MTSVAPALPYRYSSSLILVSKRPSVRVLWVERSQANPFLGGFHSFPGGRLAKEDGPTDGEAALERAMMRCAVRETFEEIGILVGLRGARPDDATLRSLREDVVEGRAEFWPSVERLGLSLDPAPFARCGRWITPPFSRLRFDTIFFLAELPEPAEPDVWPGELTRGEWVDPAHALFLWDRDEIALAMPTLHAFRVIAEGTEDLPRRLSSIPQANAVPSRHVTLNPGIVMTPLRTETLPPATHTNAVVIGDHEVVVVDPGTSETEELAALFESIDRATAEGGSVRAVLLTHRHKDHLAGVEAVRERYRAPVWAHPLTAERTRVDRALGDGERIELPGPHGRSVRAVFAPGHSRSHVAFFEERSRTLCAGDAVSTLGTVVIDPPDGDMGAYRETLETLRGLGAKTVIPGHGPPSRGVDALFLALIEHRKMRERRILDALARGGLSEEALREEVYRDTPGASPGLAARTLEAHLIVLERSGKVRREAGTVELSTP